MSGPGRIRRRRLLAMVLVAATCAVGVHAAGVADVTVDFEQSPAGTVVTNQYADAGGAGQGVVFGPLPAGAGVGPGLQPVVRVPPPGQAQSGTRVADIATCGGCEFFTPRTTATLAVPRARVSLYVGYLGEQAICLSVDPNSIGCAFVRLRVFDRDGGQVGESSVRVTRGAGVHSLLTVSVASATIVGFEISGRPMIDDMKQIAIDDLTFATPPAAPAPDFTLNPTLTNLIIEQGAAVTGTITIGRLNASSGGIAFSADGLPPGITATFTPNPAAGSQTVLTLEADANASSANTAVRITGTPQSAGAGPTAKSFTINVAVQPACPQVATAAALVEKLAKGHKCVYVKDGVRIDLSRDLAGVTVPEHLTDGASILVIPNGVTLMGGRSPTRAGATIALSERPANREKVFVLRLDSNTRVTGLRLEGYNKQDRKDRGDETRAIAITGTTDVIVDNNEIFGWPHSGVYVTEQPDRRTAPRITRNFIHHNVQCNEGQGVQFSTGGFAHIDRNVFDYNRHDVGSLAGADGYVAELNFSLTSGPKCDPGDTFQHYNQHYDMHGEHGGYGGAAGTYVLIRRNTIRGAQNYYRVMKRPAFWLRGTPRDRAIFVGNAVPHGKGMDQHTVEGRTISSKGAVRVGRGVSAISLLLKRKLIVRSNHTCVDTGNELAAGDFDGDRRADVFGAVGTVWVWSPSGSREWFFLNASTLRLSRLGFGDFDGDGKTDVFWQDRGRWLISSGGAGPPRALPAGSTIDVKQLRFGDFDGDRKTDVFRASGSRFFFSSGGATQWQPLAASRLKVADLRFGDFDGDGKTDVFSLVNNQWSVSDGGAGAWRRLNRKLSSDLRSLAFADFDGDGKTDIARSSGGKWHVSSGGASPWRTLQFGRSEPLSAGMLFADFTGDGRADVLQYGPAITTTPFCSPLAFSHFRLSSGGSQKPERWSYAAMR